MNSLMYFVVCVIEEYLTRMPQLRIAVTVSYFYKTRFKKPMYIHTICPRALTGNNVTMKKRRNDSSLEDTGASHSQLITLDIFSTRHFLIC